MTVVNPLQLLRKQCEPIVHYGAFLSKTGSKHCFFFFSKNTIKHGHMTMGHYKGLYTWTNCWVPKSQSQDCGRIARAIETLELSHKYLFQGVSWLQMIAVLGHKLRTTYTMSETAVTTIILLLLLLGLGFRKLGQC